MEDMRLSSHSKISHSVEDAGTIIEARFLEFCKKGLSMDANTTEKTIELFQECKHILATHVSAFGDGTLEESQQYWFAFILYCVRRLTKRAADNVNQGGNENGFTLCHILRKANLNFVDFFKELPPFLDKAGSILSKLYGTDWEKRLEAKELKTNFVHLSLLSKYYNRAYREFFLIKDAKVDKQSVVCNGSGYVSDYYRFGWLLFLALCVHVLGRFKTLLACTNGLVSILAILIIHVPVHIRNFSINDSAVFVKKGNKVDLLASLCNFYETSEDELRKTLEQANNLIVDILKKKSSLASETRTANLENIDEDGLIYFDDLMEESSLSSSLIILEKDYDHATCNKGEVDERMFINDEDRLLGSASFFEGPTNISGSKRKLDLVASPTKTTISPLSSYDSPPASHLNGNPGSGNSKMTATPVRTAMATAKWLRAVVSPLPAKPSPELEKFLFSCDRDITSDVIRRARIILEAIFPSSGYVEHCAPGSLQGANLLDDIWAEQRKLEAMKLYYRVLEAMCRAEAQVLHARNLTSLLTNERFHRCMLACSAELVLATHKTITMLFPAVLERTGITAFDLSKVIESFIRHEESLPRELRRHLNSLEERLLDSMVWEKGSSMYNSLAVARPALSVEINRLGLLAEPMPSLDAIAMHVNMFSGGSAPMCSIHQRDTFPGQNGDIRSPKRACSEFRSMLVERSSFTSPVKDRFVALNKLKSKLSHPALQSAFASPTRPNPVGGGETCAETAINVFFGKIVKLAALRINAMVEKLQLPQIRENVYHLFKNILSQQTGLFFHRHIDQIILCCFYAVAKVSHLKLTFKEILSNYRKQPQCKLQVFRSVFVDWSTVHHNAKTGQEHVDIVIFYNGIFVPSVKNLLEELSPVKAAQETNQVSLPDNDNDGECPRTPKPSTFPSLPDMSPKKVSATHNVYVSPLRASKMDALISSSCKSYYACVGESTHPFQSPSKDLTDINNRLNGTRRLRGRLNLDVDVGLVSDAMVANSLCFQTGSCVPSAAASIKPEQPNL